MKCSVGDEPVLVGLYVASGVVIDVDVVIQVVVTCVLLRRICEITPKLTLSRTS